MRGLFRAKPTDAWIWAGIAMFPVLFAWYTLNPGFGVKDRLGAFGWAAIVVTFWIVNSLRP